MMMTVMPFPRHGHSLFAHCGDYLVRYYCDTILRRWHWLVGSLSFSFGYEQDGEKKRRDISSYTIVS